MKELDRSVFSNPLMSLMQECIIQSAKCEIMTGRTGKTMHHVMCEILVYLSTEIFSAPVDDSFGYFHLVQKLAGVFVQWKLGKSL